MIQDRWKPVHRGSIYCSPACGRGCTYAAFQAATKAASRLAKSLPGFEPRVWENLGWHQEVRCGAIIVKQYGRLDFQATLGCTFWVEGRTALGALRALVREQRRQADASQAHAAQIEAVVRRCAKRK